MSKTAFSTPSGSDECFINEKRMVPMMFKEEYNIDFFEERGFVRKRCTGCGEAFWTLDGEMETCQDTPCTRFDFIGSPPTDRRLTVPEMRRYFLDFFSERGHVPLERYPVVARWRDDVFLVHASIYDFQPHATSGLVKPPANPLVISQPCIRMPDLDDVGRTGKHMTSFEMMGHHAFNSSDEYVYWKDETVRYCHEMLVSLGVDEGLIAYKEHPWIGGGNAGPSLEVNVCGLEIATLVFMNLERHPEGEVELEGDKYRPLALNVVDTGYGLERWVWMSDGAPTIYDSIYPDIVQYICDEAGLEHDLERDDHRVMLEEYTRLAGTLKRDFTHRGLMDELVERLSAMGYETRRSVAEEKLGALKSVYTIADHSRTVAFMLSDGIVPSNVAEGYLARLMIRRTLRQIARLGGDISLKMVVKKQMEKFGDIIDTSKEKVVFEMLDSEIRGYGETLERGKRLVKRALEGLKGDNIPLESLIEFYDTHGIHPTVVRDMADELGVSVDIPGDFNVLLARMHERTDMPVDEEARVDHHVPDTEMLYYQDQHCRTFHAVVLHSRNGEVILDGTGFYPEGGGQEGDTGVMESDGRTFKVINVRKEGGVIIHETEGDIPVGKTVQGRIDGERREAMTRHHTATHIIISCARRVLGDHIWQRGAHKSPENARLDISHYKRITRAQLKEIERMANVLVLRDIPVHTENLSRDDAEERFGFELYQGGVPASDVIRVVHITDVRDYDAQACGGTHVDRTSEIGAIKILGSQRIQDGVERLTFTAGMAAVEYVQHMEDLLIKTGDILSVDIERVPETARRFFREWKDRGKELEKLKGYRAMAMAHELLPGEVERDVEFVTAVLDDMDTREMLALAEDITSGEGRVVLLASLCHGVQLVFSRSDDVDIDMGEVLREAAKEIGGSGGGTGKTAQGGGKDAEGVERALVAGKNEALARLLP